MLRAVVSGPNPQIDEFVVTVHGVAQATEARVELRQRRLADAPIQVSRTCVRSLRPGAGRTAPFEGGRSSPRRAAVLAGPDAARSRATPARPGETSSLPPRRPFEAPHDVARGHEYARREFARRPAAVAGAGHAPRERLLFILSAEPEANPREFSRTYLDAAAWSPTRTWRAKSGRP